MRNECWEGVTYPLNIYQTFKQTANEEIWLMSSFFPFQIVLVFVCFHSVFRFATDSAVEQCLLHTFLWGERKKWQSTLVSSASYSALTAPFLRAFVTLMHWSANISGMLIPRFEPCCGIATYCLSFRVSRLLCTVRCWETWFPHSTVSGERAIVDDLVFQKLKAPCGACWLR